MKSLLSEYAIALLAAVITILLLTVCTKVSNQIGVTLYNIEVSADTSQTPTF
jgi:Flp pilus assembly pilin Flp